MTGGCRLAVMVSVAALLVTWPAPSLPSQAQEPRRTRGIQVKPNKALGGVALELHVEVVRGRDGAPEALRSGRTLRVGDEVVLCFSASADGYVTVWSRDAEGNLPKRIYPNEFAAETAHDRAHRVEREVETCIGDDDGFRLEVGRPLGEASVYLHYTRREDLQFDESAFPQIRATRGLDPRPYASRYLRYRVVD